MGLLMLPLRLAGLALKVIVFLVVLTTLSGMALVG